MSILSTTLTTSIAPIYTCSPSLNMSTITSVYFCNIGAASASVNIYATPAGDTASNSNIIYSAVIIAPGSTFVMDTERLVLDKNDFISAISTVGSSVVATVSFMGL